MIKIQNKENEFSNIEELMLAINGTKWKIESLWLHNNSDLICSWVLSFLDITYLSHIMFSNVTLSFIDQLNKVIKGSK